VERDHVLQRRGFEILDAADRRTLVRMHLIRRRRDRVVEATVRRCEDALPILFLDHGALGLEDRLIDIEIRHALGFGPQQRLEMIRRNHFVIGRHVVARERVVRAADVFGQSIELFVL
jgi:hypothetical protein